MVGNMIENNMRAPADKKYQAVLAVLKEGKSIRGTAKEFGVARKTLYQWIAKYKEASPREKPSVLAKNAYVREESHPRASSWRYKKVLLQFVEKNPELSLDELSRRLHLGRHATFNLLSSLNLSSQEARLKLSRTYQPSGRLDPGIKTKIAKEVLEGKRSVAELSQAYNLARKTIYQWLKRYKDEGKVSENYACGSSHHRAFSVGEEQMILLAVAKSPGLSIHQLASTLNLSSHGIWNVLKRHELTYKEQRIDFAQAQVEIIEPTVPATPVSVFNLPLRFLRMVIAPFATVPKSSWFYPASLGISSIIFLIIFARFWHMMFQGASVENRLGLIFATISLVSGLIFFLYSLKYYLTLALVLGFSRHVGLSEETNEGNILPSWLTRFLEPNKKNWEYRGGLQPDLEKVNLQRTPFVSVHLPVYNEENVINRLLTACTSFSYPNYEVIVIDDSTDETTQILEEWKNHPRVKIVHRESREGFKGGALKVAMQRSDPRAEFVLIFDADYVPYSDTITQFLKYFQSTTGTLDFVSAGLPSGETGANSNIAAVQGYQWHVLNKSENWITRGVRSEYAGSYIIERSGTEVLGSLKQISGSVYMIRKNILEKFGWQTSITEDFQLTLRLYEAGYKVVYTPYIQGPAECVSTLQRLIRQRMRWAEGHSHNIRNMIVRMLFGKWETVKRDTGSHKKWTSSPLTFLEKLEFIYLSPYYLQAAFFILGTFCWLISETVFKARLPFWTALWGWSLVLTNMFALPLMNTVGLFLEESEEKDYIGILSFVGLSYLLVPFQAYASIKGFLEKEEGPWFRTPKTGKITDILNRGKFYRWLSGIFPGRQPSPAFQPNMEPVRPATNPYLALATSNNRFNNFIVKNRRLGWLAKSTLALLLIFSITIVYFSYGLPQVEATNFTNFYLHPEAAAGTPAAPAAANSMDNVAPGAGTVGVEMRAQRNVMNSGTLDYVFYSDIFPTQASNAVLGTGNWQVNIIKAGGTPARNIINFGIQLFVSNANGAAQNQILGNTARINIGLNANNTALSFNLNPTALAENYEISSDNKQRIGFRIFWKNSSNEALDWTNLVINNATEPSLVEAPAFNVPEIPILALAIPIYVMIPLVPGLVKRARQQARKKNIWQELAGDWQKFFLGLTGFSEEYVEDDV